MLVLLSPAKSLDMASAVPDLAFTQPQFLDKASKLARAAAKLRSADLQALMHISEPLAALNEARFKSFQTPFTPDNARPALFTFAGDVYTGLDAASLDSEGIAFAQDHIRILSGLYGLLRPLDLMQPYRLEMGTRFGIGKATTLYEVWQRKIAPALAAELADEPDPLVINLASEEYFKSVDLMKLPARLLTIDFRDRKAGKLRFNSFVAKKARGAAARAVIDARLEAPEPLRTQSILGHRFDADASTADRWMFIRAVD
ncbi:peroxide stress protein YaaA [Polymorphobacter sp.]|uniref:peroxide stress protein YaaA n=1 Tax=Polymorphobacter sp. TaxID=1909290 RepID=UPI003F6F2BF2